MPTDIELPWTGERLVTSYLGNTALEHLHRYAFAREYAQEKDILDIACGEGYGAYLLADVARSVIGVDIAEDVIEHARRKYGDNPKLSFKVGGCSEIPIDDASVDLVVSLETLEHHNQHEQMLREVKRVLRPGGTLIISTPDRLYYSIIPRDSNPYHRKELFKGEFQSLLQSFFSNVSLFEQKICQGSVVTPDAGRRIGEFRHYLGDFHQLGHTRGIAGPLINLAVATDSEAELAANVSLFQGVGIPTDMEKQLAEANRSNGELRARLAEQEARSAWFEQHGKDLEASYRGHLVEQEARFNERLAEIESSHAGETAGMRAQFAEESARSEQAHSREIDALGGELQSVRGELQSVRGELQSVRGELQSVRGELQSVRGELQAIEGSRAWRWALRVRRWASALRKLRAPLGARPLFQR
jgi:ubiquinone/menaquinone biosynthesis C-methylase UbiE